LLKKAEKVEDEAEDPPLVSLIRTKWVCSKLWLNRHNIWCSNEILILK
jgi:hypothetical protein